jgi:hypothetical protein
MKRTLAAFAVALALSAIAFAHGNEKHVMGTVTSISDNSIRWRLNQRRRLR